MLRMVGQQWKSEYYTLLSGVRSVAHGRKVTELDAAALGDLIERLKAGAAD